ncbi:hypothetical protein JCM11641_002234 [Rhodosporidiobolus odoratus]
MLRFTLLSAVVAAAAVRASSVSTSVFPNLMCGGASELGGRIGVGQLKQADGSVEYHCGCPSDGLAEFELCPSSATGEAACTSVYDYNTKQFSAACSVVTCSGDDCPSTVVNTAEVDQDECYNSEKGAIGITTVDGEAKCSCSTEAEDDFTACPSPANGHAVCRTVDSDYITTAPGHSEAASCAVECDEGFFLTPGGSCVNFAKRAVAGPSGSYHTAGPGKVGPSASWSPSKTPVKVGPSATSGPSSRPNWHSSHPGSAYPGSAYPTAPVAHNPHAAHPPSYNTEPVATTTTTTYSYKHHHHHPTDTPSAGSSSRPNWRSSSAGPIKVGGSSTPAYGAPSSYPVGHGSNPYGGSSYPHHHHSSAPRHHPSSRPSWTSHSSGPVKVPSPEATTSPEGGFTRSRGPGKVGPSAAYTPTAGPGYVALPAPSQYARRAAEEFVFSDACAQDERTCPAGELGDFSCVRLDDVTECGGCNATGEASNCLEIKGAASVACLRGGCVVRSCQTGYVQTSEGACEAKA